MKTFRPSDLAREHGLSAQAVRNYERDGFLPPADRTDTGYRIYTAWHALALRTFLTFIPAYGHGGAGRIMNALHSADLDAALAIVDSSHAQLLRDRQTLAAVRAAVGHLTGDPATATSEPTTEAWTVGDLAHRLQITAATLRNWERAGILAPQRDRRTGHRTFRASDVRDAELTHLLRRGGYPLDHIAPVVQQVRSAGGTDELSGALDDWHEKITRRALAMLTAAAQFDRYLRSGYLNTNIRRGEPAAD